MRGLGVLCLVVVTVSCGPRVAESEDGETGSTTAHVTGLASTSGNSWTSTSTSTVTSGASTDGSDGGSSTGSDPASVCDPQPDSFVAGVYIDPDAPLDSETLEIDADCVVTDLVGPDPTDQSVLLACTEMGIDTTHEVKILAEPPVDLPWVGAGATVHLRAYRDFPIDTPVHEYVVLRGAEGELLLGMYGSMGQDRRSWFAPLDFDVVEDVCPIEPPPDPPDDGSFIEDPCPKAIERLALDFFGSDWPTRRVFDARRDDVGPFEIRVPFIRKHHPLPENECSNLEQTVGQFILYRRPP